MTGYGSGGYSVGYGYEPADPWYAVSTTPDLWTDSPSSAGTWVEQPPENDVWTNQ